MRNHSTAIAIRTAMTIPCESYEIRNACRLLGIEAELDAAISAHAAYCATGCMGDAEFDAHLTTRRAYNLALSSRERQFQRTGA